MAVSRSVSTPDASQSSIPSETRATGVRESRSSARGDRLAPIRATSAARIWWPRLSESSDQRLELRPLDGACFHRASSHAAGVETPGRNQQQMQSRKALAPRGNRGSQLTVHRASSGPIRSKRLTREGFTTPPPGYAAVREPPANRPMVPACCRGGSPDRHSRPVTSRSDARSSGWPTWLSGSLRASRTRRERTRSAGAAG